VKHEILEKTLRKKRIVRRCIELGLAVAFMILAIVSIVLIETTAEVITHDLGYGYTREDTVYNEAYIPFITVGIVGTVAALSYLLGDFMSCRFETVEVNGYYVTVNRALISREVYVDGKLEGSLCLQWGYFIEIVLPDGTRVSVAFGRAWYELCYVSFSNGRPAIEL